MNITEVNTIFAMPHITMRYAAPPAVNVSVITFFAAMPQATLQQFTNAGLVMPLACVIVTVEAFVAPANDVVKYSVNTFCEGQQGLPFFDT